MAMPAIPASVVAEAESTLTSSCVITRTAGAATFTPGSGITTPPPTTVFAGRCSISAPKTARPSEAGGDERTVDSRTVRLPGAARTTETGDPGAVHRGDAVSIPGEPPMIVDELLDGTTRALHRIRCVATNDAPGVPT